MRRACLKKPKPITPYSIREKPTGRPRMRWEDVVKKDDEQLGEGTDRKARAG